jgi:hypothetical protein
MTIVESTLEIAYDLVIAALFLSVRNSAGPKWEE